MCACFLLLDIGAPGVMLYSFSHFPFCPQLPPTMSQRRKQGLSKEELEIQHILSPASHSTVSVSDIPPHPGQRHNDAVAPPASLSTECMQDLASLLTKSLVDALNKSGTKRPLSPCPDRQDMISSDEGEDEDDVGFDNELPTGQPFVASRVTSLFEVGVNESGHLRDHDYLNDPDSTKAQVHVPAASPHNDVTSQTQAVLAPAQVNASAPPPVVAPSAAAAPVVAPAPVVEPDDGLPMPSSRHPPNWKPHPAVLSWATMMIDSCEWSASDREVIDKQFTPDSEFEHLFTAVPAPPDMLSALKHPRTKELDYLFKRFEIDNHLYSANQDLSCGFRPLIEVISNLREVPGMEHNRKLLGFVYQSMASSISHVSIGRRELGRRFVPLANAAALYRKKPSHYCLFGDSSIENAVKEAVSASKVNKDLVVLPKKPVYQQPFRHSYSTGKSQYRGKFQPSRQQSSSGRRGKFSHSQKGRGRGSRRGQGQRQQAKTSQE